MLSLLALAHIRMSEARQGEQASEESNPVTGASELTVWDTGLDKVGDRTGAIQMKRY